MLSWLKGGPSTAYALEDMNSASNDNELRHGNINTAEQDEDAFTDTSSEEDAPSDDVQPPQTPAPMFALKAIRTVVWGTPAPPKPRERPTRRKKRSPKSKGVTAATKEKKKEGEPLMSDTTEKHAEQPIATRASRPNPKSLVPIPFKISPKSNLFDPSSSSSTSLPHATSNRPPSPAKGILMTSGAGLNRKKAVSFHPSVGETTPPPRNGHIRSGLPHEFPGKFPSPWTPRAGTPQHKRSISVPGPSSPSRTQTFEDGPLNLDKGKKPERSTASNPIGYYEVGEDSRITNYLDDSDDEKADQQLQREVSIHEEGNLTIDMEAPRSSSGKFWKERTQKIEDMAQEKVERLRERCKIATGYAKKKDELCVDLAEKIRELAEKNKRLKAELKRLNQQSENAAGNFAFTRITSSRATGHGSRALEEALHAVEERDMQIAAYTDEKARMENALQEHKQRVEAFEELLNTREDRITELSMNMYNGGNDEDLEEVVFDLKKKLRTAKQDVKELSLVKIEARDLRERVGSLEQRFADVMAEKERMERELENLRVGDEMSLSTLRHPSAEGRLKQQIEALEKAKRELRMEMREKTLTEAKERRELERKSRSELADMKGKVASAEWEKDKLEREIKDLKEYVTRLERELETTKKGNGELKKRLADQAPAGNDHAREWQAKQRTTLQELRRVKEETSTLRVQKGDVEEQLRSARKDIENLKVQLDSLPEVLAKPAPETKEPESLSDDSAVDRSFDRWTKAATASTTNASSFSSGAKSSMTRPAASAFTLTNSPPVPALANRQKRLFSAETLEKENSDILPTPPEPSTLMQTLNAAETPEDGSFYQQRRQRESPRAKIVNLQTLNAAETPEDGSFYQQRCQRESPRAKIVNLAITPPASSAPAARRKVSYVGKVAPRRAVSGSGRLSNMDPVRREAAAQRLAERNKARLGSAGIA